MRVQSTEQTKAHAIIRRNGRWISEFFLGYYWSCQLKACSDILSSALDGRPQPSPGPAVLSSSESPHAGVLHLQNSQQVFRFQPQAMNSLFSNCHVQNVQVFMGNNSAGFHWTNNYLDPLFCCFLRTETEHWGTCFEAINSNFVWFLSSHFPVDWCFDKPLFH